MTLRLHKTIAEMAKIATATRRKLDPKAPEVTPREMRRTLLRMNEEVHGTLLVPSRGKNRKWLVNEVAFREAFPEHFETIRDMSEDVEVLKLELEELKESSQLILQRIGEITRELSAVRRRVDAPKTSTNVDQRRPRKGPDAA